MIDLDLDLVADLTAHRPPGGCSMASLPALYIGRPCNVRCTPRAERTGLGDKLWQLKANHGTATGCPQR